MQGCTLAKVMAERLGWALHAVQLFSYAVMQVCTFAGVMIEGSNDRLMNVTSAIIQLCTNARVHSCKGDGLKGWAGRFTGAIVQLCSSAGVHLCKNDG
jgi:hypothetical protein